MAMSSTEAFSPLKAIRSIGVPRKRNFLRVEIEVWKVRHDVLSHLASCDSHNALHGIQSDFLFVFLLPARDLSACIRIGQLLQLGFKRLPLLTTFGGTVSVRGEIDHVTGAASTLTDSGRDGMVVSDRASRPRNSKRAVALAT